MTDTITFADARTHLTRTVHRLLYEAAKANGGVREVGLWPIADRLTLALLTDPIAKGQLGALLADPPE